MRLLFCGDIVGRAGRDVIVERLPALKRAGVDCITTGNHVWDQKETVGFIGNDPRLLRPHNFPVGTPGKGTGIYPTAKGKKVGVINLMGRLFMDPLDDPFQQIEQLLNAHRLGGNCDAIILDFHGEATSEKMAMGHVVDGRVSLCVGTHTHVPTADHMILAKGTAYQTDAGMCGDYDSVIGMDKAMPIARFTRKMPTERLSAANGPGTLCAVLVETDDATGLAKSVQPVRLGGKLSQTSMVG
jgi:metallophosphoesterase (TIGR00282 family)